MGKINKHISINADYFFLGKLKIFMVNYIVNMLVNIPEDMKKKSDTPAGHHLFDTYENTFKLTKSDTELFHHVVAQILYL